MDNISAITSEFVCKPPVPNLAANFALMRRIDDANNLLRLFKEAAVQEKKIEKDGKIIGQITYGYKPQYVVDVANRTVGPSNWAYDVIEETEQENQFVTHIQMKVKVDGIWIVKGSQYGVGQIVRTTKAENITDGRKSAIVNGIQKCLSLLSIGTDAYRGLLKGVYFGGALKPRFCQQDLTSLMTEMEFLDRILAVNREIESFGKDAIQKKEIGQVTYGFKPQFVFDAVNRHIGPANWRWEVVGIDITGTTSRQAGAAIRVYFLVDGEWFDKGMQYGVTPIVHGNIGDAFKGAIVNGIQKCFAACSIGSNAYRGLLQPVFENNRPSQGPQPNAAQENPTANKPSTPASMVPDEALPGASSANIPASSNQQAPLTSGLPKLPGAVIIEKSDHWLAKAAGQNKMPQATIASLMEHGFIWQEFGQGENVKLRLIKLKEAAAA